MPVKAASKPVAKPFTLTAPGKPAAIAQATGEGDAKKLGTFTGLAYTGAVMQPQGWGGPIILDLDGIKVPNQHRPALRQHDHEQIVGHTNTVKVSNPEGIEVAGVFSGEAQHTTKVTTPAGNGFQWQMSVGANPIRTEYLESGEETEVNGRTVTGPLTISRETELGEVSFVPLGADGDTTADVSASKRRVSNMFKAMLKAAKANGNILAGKYSDDEITGMDEEQAKSALRKCMKGEDSLADEDPKKDADGKQDDDAKAKAKAKASGEDTEDTDDDKADKKTEAKVRKSIEAAARAGIAASRQMQADESKRVTEIQARCNKHGVVMAEVDTTGGKRGRVNLAAHGIAAGWTPDQVELEALREARPNNSGGPLVFSTSTPETNEAVLEAAILQGAGCELFDDEFYTGRRGEREAGIRPKDARTIKASVAERYPDSVQQAAHKLFKGRIGLQQALTVIARDNGYRGDSTISMGNLGTVAEHCTRVRADGSSTLSVSNIVANVMNKFLLQGYMYTEQTWKEVAATRAVKDFKAVKSINLFGDVEFQDVGPSGELKNASLQDQAFANSVTTSGRLVTLPRTIIINDDLGALGMVPMMLGRGAGLKLNRVFWSKFMVPGNDNGGATAFFAATHTIANEKAKSNLSTGGGSALSNAGLTAAVLLFDKQIDPAGYPMGIDAEILLYPPELQTTSLELMNSERILAVGGASKQGDANIWKNRFKTFKSRYMSNTDFTGNSATAYYLFANPAIVPVIEIAFLNGVEMPTVQQAGQDFQFNILGITTRAFFDIGVNMQNFRGGVRSDGV